MVEGGGGRGGGVSRRQRLKKGDTYRNRQKKHSDADWLEREGATGLGRVFFGHECISDTVHIHIVSAVLPSSLALCRQLKACTAVALCPTPRRGFDRCESLTTLTCLSPVISPPSSSLPPRSPAPSPSPPPPMTKCSNFRIQSTTVTSEVGRGRGRCVCCLCPAGK